MKEQEVFVDGIAWWSATSTDWQQAADAWGSSADAAAEPGRGVGVSIGPSDPIAVAPAHSTHKVARPSPDLLAANEKRRAPDTVLLALQVAQAASVASGHEASSLTTVFCSAHGDLPTTDAMCRSLAQNPLLLSPTRFHHSVHNAAAGYWAIASGSHAASTALAAHDYSFAAGWLEAASICACDGVPVLLVAYDTEAVGPLASVNGNRELLAMAMVLSPVAGPKSRWKLGWRLQNSSQEPAQSPAAEHAAGWRPSTAAAIPLLQALARLQTEGQTEGQTDTVLLDLGETLQLRLSIQGSLPNLVATEEQQSVAIPTPKPDTA